MSKNKDTNDKEQNLNIKEAAEASLTIQTMSLAEFTGETTVLSKDICDVFPLKDQMEGVEPRLPQIGIAHSAQMFVMPDESKVEEFIGIILDHNRANAWWEVSFDQSGGGSPPTCWSLDGNRPNPSIPSPQCESCITGEWSCITCVQNQFGTEIKRDGTQGRGKACKNMKRVHILLKGSSIPHRLTLPPSNLKAFDNYVTYLSGRNLRLPLILTQFRLSKAQNQDGIEYSEVDLDYICTDDGTPVFLATTKAQAEEIRAFRESWLSAMRGQEIVADEFSTPSGDNGDTSFDYGENIEDLEPEEQPL